MADNTTLNSGSGGDTIATDDISGVKHQRVKIEFGGDGAATDVSSADPLPVNGTINLGATDNAVLDEIAANTSATAVAAQLIDNAISGNEMQVDIVTGQVDVAFGGVAVSSAAPLPIQAADANGLKIQDGGGVISIDNGGVPIGVQIQDTGFAVADGNALGEGVLIQGDDGTDRKNVNVDATTGDVQVDVTNTVTVDNGGTFAVQVDAALPTGSNAIGKLAANSGVDIGDVDVLSIAAGSNLIGNVGVGVRTSGGTSIFRSLDLDETEEAVKATAGQVYWIHAMNLASSVRYLKLYNATVATVVVGTTTPVLTFPLATQGDSNGAGFTISIPNGIAFGTAITAAATTGLADNDTGAPGANEVVVNIGYA